MAFTCAYCSGECSGDSFGSLPAIPRGFELAHRLRGKKSISLCPACWRKLTQQAVEEEILTAEELIDALYEAYDDLQDRNEELARASDRVDQLTCEGSDMRRELDEKEEYVPQDEAEKASNSAYDDGYTRGLQEGREQAEEDFEERNIPSDPPERSEPF